MALKLSSIIASLFIVTITSLEFIDSRDDNTKAFIKACTSKPECFWLQIEKKALTNKHERDIIIDTMDKLIQTKENNQ
jgi:hypothetical protein